MLFHRVIIIRRVCIIIVDRIIGEEGGVEEGDAGEDLHHLALDLNFISMI